jgi:outer membrane protein OmpA-like peptidoglycan-associated protein
MAGLMLVFMAIAIFYMRLQQIRVADIKVICEEYIEVRKNLADEIESSLGTDLKEWNAHFDKGDLSVTFENTGRSYFESGSDRPKRQFVGIIDDFFPKYLTVLKNHKAGIKEIRIEGHTDRSWRKGDDAYIGNMGLSQRRAKTVLAQIKKLDAVKDNWHWLEPVMTANGLSFSQPVMSTTHPDEPDYAASRRVVFKLRTDAAQQLDEVCTRLDGIR